MSSELESHAGFEATFIGWLYRQFTKPKPLPAGTDLTDQVAIITGSNTGLGFEACRQFLKLGLSHLIMAVRSQVKGDEAADQLRSEFPTSNISVWTLEMESYDSIRAFADRCATLPRIDIVLLNAALMKMAHTTVPATGHELTMQVNYLSTALLAILLLPILKSKRPSVPKDLLFLVLWGLTWRIGWTLKPRALYYSSSTSPRVMVKFPGTPDLN